MNKKLLIAIGAVIVAVTIIVVALSCGSSGPEYVNQLKADGYPVTSQSGLTGGEGVGYAWGCNGNYGELVGQLKSDLDAKSFADQFDGWGASVTSQGDLVSIKASCSDISTLVQNAGWH